MPMAVVLRRRSAGTKERKEGLLIATISKVIGIPWFDGMESRSGKFAANAGYKAYQTGSSKTDVAM